MQWDRRVVIFSRLGTVDCLSSCRIREFGGPRWIIYHATYIILYILWSFFMDARGCGVGYDIVLF